jgi:uncharacterized protein involved in exopolysaccharide biosynthesis
VYHGNLGLPKVLDPGGMAHQIKLLTRTATLDAAAAKAHVSPTSLRDNLKLVRVEGTSMSLDVSGRGDVRTRRLLPAVVAAYRAARRAEQAASVRDGLRRGRTELAAARAALRGVPHTSAKGRRAIARLRALRAVLAVDRTLGATLPAGVTIEALTTRPTSDDVNRPATAMLGVIVGLFIGCAAALVLALADDVLLARRLPVFARVPRK